LGCEQFFCRCQQQDNHTGRSSFEPDRHGTEMVSPPAGAYISSFTICHVLPDLLAHIEVEGTQYPLPTQIWPNYREQLLLKGDRAIMSISSRKCTSLRGK
jgi:hypothetical protein